MKEKLFKTVELRSFVDGKQKETHKLTPAQARALHTTAMHLAQYLASSYGFAGDHMAACFSHMDRVATVWKAGRGRGA